MTQKTFYIDIKKQEFHEKKSINKEVVFKSLIRTSTQSKEIKIIDTNSKIFSMKRKRRDNIWSVGKYIFTNRFMLRHKLLKYLRIETQLTPRKLCNNSLTKFTNSMSIHMTRINSKFRRRPFIIVKMIKGGFITYYAGLKGFLPRSQYLLSLKNFLKHRKKFFQKKIKNFNKKNYNKIINTKKNFLKKKLKLLPLRLKLRLVGMNFVPGSVAFNFSKSKLRRKFPKSMGFVFLYTGKGAKEKKLLEARRKIAEKMKQIPVKQFKKIKNAK